MQYMITRWNRNGRKLSESHAPQLHGAMYQLATAIGESFGHPRNNSARLTFTLNTSNPEFRRALVRGAVCQDTRIIFSTIRCAQGDMVTWRKVA